MNVLGYITKSVELQMELSRLLFEILWPERAGCEGALCTSYADGKEVYKDKCDVCGLENGECDPLGRNLFTPESFLTVWNAVKDREDFRKQHYTAYGIFVGSGKDNSHTAYRIDFNLIASPHFQYEVLKWLNPEGLAEVMKKKKRKTPYERQLP